MKISFTSNYDIKYNSCGKMTHANITNAFRKDLVWDKYADFLIDKYKNTDKVNVYCYACSDGSEPYSLAIKLMQKLGEDGAQKFFPIKAKDFDKEKIEEAKRGYMQLTMLDIEKIKEQTGRPASDFFDFTGEEKKQFKICTPKDSLREKVEFEYGDVTKDASQLEGKDTVFMFRNAWPYLSRPDQVKLSETLSEKLDNNSVCVIGDYDLTDSETGYYLLDDGFKCTDINYVYEKPQKKPTAFTGQFLMNYYTQSH